MEFKNTEFYDKFMDPLDFKIYKDLYSCSQGLWSVAGPLGHARLATTVDYSS